MAIKIPRSFIEAVLLGAPDARRQLQDSPILGDVWIKYGDDPAGRHHLLITSHIEASAKAAAAEIYRRLDLARTAKEANISFLQGVVAASLTLEELFRDIVPLTDWWHRKPIQAQVKNYFGRASGSKIQHVANAVLRNIEAGASSERGTGERLTALDRYAVLAGLMLWAAKSEAKIESPSDANEGAGSFAGRIRAANPPIGELLRNVIAAIYEANSPKKLVFQISLNRKAMPAIQQSVLAVKGDTVKQLFAVDCSRIAWAIIDSGVDTAHPAFKDGKNKCRVVQSYDFTHFRRIVSMSNVDGAFRKKTVEELRANRAKPLSAKETDQLLLELAENSHAQDDVRGINWDYVERLVALTRGDIPTNDHGTHVAGILGARKDAKRDDSGDGMCPTIKLYDFRVLAPTLEDTEFAIMGALQYIRQLNARHGFITIHGANLSLSIPHDVRNYACGRTPICMECEQLVESGVVVVAAAGNLGYQRFETRDGLYEGYAAFSVTDPGNADGVITVGSTHRTWPHTYGVSFFSSRGPTGDGRSKPDLVAPGERIHAPIIGRNWGDLDGTSMAAPHVSGAAAMLMARYTELIGQPRRIKRLLCDSATDLGREKSFQGHGMLDVLRAFQQI